MYLKIRLDEVTNVRLAILQSQIRYPLAQIVDHGLKFYDELAAASQLPKSRGKQTYTKGLYLSNKAHLLLHQIAMQSQQSLNETVTDAINYVYERKVINNGPV